MLSACEDVVKMKDFPHSKSITLYNQITAAEFYGTSDDMIKEVRMNERRGATEGLQTEFAHLPSTSVTGFAGYEYFDDVDVDWLPLQFIDRSDVHDFEQFSQEIRWAADIGDRFTYTMGGYIDQNELDMQGQVVIDTNFDGLFPAFLALANGLEYVHVFLRRSWSGRSVPAAQPSRASTRAASPAAFTL